jgi:hypothetical protein
MIKNGAEWLHMGESFPFVLQPLLILPVTQMSWMGNACCFPVPLILYSVSFVFPDISCRILLWVCRLSSIVSAALQHRIRLSGAPILTCVRKGVPDIFMDCHMMVSEPEKVRATITSPHCTVLLNCALVGERYRRRRRCSLLFPLRSNLYVLAPPDFPCFSPLYFQPTLCPSSKQYTNAACEPVSPFPPIHHPP